MFQKRLNQSISLYLLLVFLLGLMSTLDAHAQAEAASLQTAIEEANRQGRGSITLTGDIILGGPLPPITGEIEIEGKGHSISGANAYRIFVVDGGDLTIRNLTLTDGSSPEDGGAIFLQNGGELVIEYSTFAGNWSEKGGGAISSSPSAVKLSIRNSIFNDNSSGSGGGAVLAFGGETDISGSLFLDNEAANFGGGVEAFVGEVDIWNSTFVGNQAGQGGGILVSGAQTKLTHLTLVENEARWGEGDALYVRDGEAYLRNSMVAGGGAALDCSGRQLAESSGNFSEDGTCALLPGGDPLLAEMTGSPAYFPLQDGSPAVDAAESEYCLDVDQRGQARPQGGGCDIGAIESATATAAEPTPAPTVCTLANHILSANTNTSVGGCPTGTSHDVITISEDITLEEPLPPINGTITIEGNGHKISGANQFRIFVVAGRTLTINNLTLARGYVEGNGGAILVQNDAELVVNNSHFQSNRVEAIRQGNRGYQGNGGAIGTRNFKGAISVNNSVFTGNFAGSFGGAIAVNGGTVTIRDSVFTRNRAGPYGGALEISSGRLNIENSTFYRNSASLAGGIAVWGGTATMTHLTMLANRVSLDGRGGAIHHWGGQAILRNSIVARGSNYPDCHGAVSGSGNYSQDGTCPGSVADKNPLLANPLLSMAMDGTPGVYSPQARSPVVDAADPAFCLPTDQAGNPRPYGAGCDIGAVEFRPESLAGADSVTDAQAGAGCQVTTIRGLDLRDAPRGKRIDAMGRHKTLPATARTQDWFQVEYRGATGWIRVNDVTTAGVCG